jgi:hypothetical protein
MLPFTQMDSHVMQSVRNDAISLTLPFFDSFFLSFLCIPPRHPFDLQTVYQE